MLEWAETGLSTGQVGFLERTLVAPVAKQDLSWGQFDNLVIEVETADRLVIVKAGGPGNHHIRREIAAHESVTGGLAGQGLTSPFVAADRDENVLVLGRLDGELVQGTAAEYLPDTYEQAGRLLREFHGQCAAPSEDYEQVEMANTLAKLEEEHRIEPSAVERARAILLASKPRRVELVPTHGDWQPRNWLMDRGVVRVIDFGRFGRRPAASDLVRLAAQQWLRDPALERAFFAGYGADPRDAESWRILQLREAIGTCVWCYQLGIDDFEAQGHRMLADALAAFE